MANPTLHKIEDTYAWRNAFHVFPHAADTDRDFHTLASVVAGLIPADEDELAAQQAAELQRQAGALKPRLVARFVASRSWAERWTDDPEKIREYFPAEEVEIKP